MHVEGDSASDGIIITRSGTSVVTTLHSNFFEGTIGTTSNHNFRFLANNVVAGEIKNNGNWAIGSTSAFEKLDVDGAINLGTTTNTNAGTIRFDGGDFEGYDGVSWKSLTSGGSGGSSVWSQSGNDISYSSGAVGIGTSNIATGFILSVDGKAIMEEVQVELSQNWPDYVFEEEYNLMPLSEIEYFIDQNGHLPNIPSASKVESEGIALGEMQRLMVEKIEELTLHMIELEKENVRLRNLIQEK